MRAFITAISVIAATMAATAAECLDMPVADYDEWEASVEFCASEAGWTLVNPELLPDQFDRGLTPAEAYADDEVFRIEYEEAED